MKQNDDKKVVIKYYKDDDLLFKVQKNTKNKDAKMVKTKIGRSSLSSKCAVYGSKKSRFMKEQEAK